MRFAWGVVVLVAAAACNAVLGLGNYRPCEGVECDGGLNVDSGADALPDVSTSCGSSAECAPPQPVCSNGKCVGVASLSTGSSSVMCAVLQDHTMWCWGDNAQGELGRGLIGGQYPDPRPISVVNDAIVQGVVGQDFACARTSTDVWCWGTGAAGAGPNNTYAVKVGLPTSPTGLSGGATGACAIVAGNRVYCWGRNDTGNLSCGDAGQIAVPPQSPTLMLDQSANVGDIAVGGYTSCARTNGNDTVHCFGDNSWGGLGNGTQTAQGCLTSTISGFANQLASIAAGDNAVCAIDIDGQTFCWGQNYEFNNAGIIWPSSSTPAYASPFHLPLGKMKQVSVGWLHTCVLDLNGVVTCWGESEHGTTGVFGPHGGSSPPNVIAGITASRISAQRQFTCALATSGAVLCWGNNQFDTLAKPTNNGMTTPQLVAW